MYVFPNSDLKLVRLKIINIQNGNHCGVNVDLGRDFRLLADRMTQLRNFTKGEIREFCAFPISLQLLFDRTLSNLIVFLMISQKHIKVVQTS